MDELEFRRLLERFPIVRFRDYHIDLDTSKRTSHSIEQEEERQWKEAWSKGHKPETGLQALHRGDLEGKSSCSFKHSIRCPI